MTGDGGFKPEGNKQKIENLPPEEVLVNEIRMMGEKERFTIARILKSMAMTRDQAERFAREWRERSEVMQWGTDKYQDFLGVPSALLEKKTYI